MIEFSRHFRLSLYIMEFTNSFSGCQQEDFPHNAHHREVSISISNYTLKHGDTGLIIIGGRMEMQPHVCVTFLISWSVILFCLVFCVY